MKKQLNSFRYALEGVFYTILHEGHFRFHLVAAAYVIFFGVRFYALSRAEWAAVLTLIGLVLSAECVNTALERICNKVSARYDKIIKVTKDVAAGAVLVAALSAFAIAVMLFWDVEVFKAVWLYYTTHLLRLVILLFTAALAVLFIALTPKFFGIDRESE